MATRTRRPLSSVKVRCRVQFDVRGLDTALERLDELSNPVFVLQLVRQAAAETLLTAYRTRFLERFEDVLSPEREHSASKLAESPGAKRAKESLVKAYAALAKAEGAGKRSAVTAARQRLARAEARLVKQSARPGGQSELSTGEFRERALEVLRSLTDASLLGGKATGTTVQLGIGNLVALEQVDTPSATPMLTGHPTGSAFTGLWRQLEFGTGVYSKFPGIAHTGWTYGSRPGFGLKMLGAHGVQAVFDAATGLPYTQDALKFESVFAGLLGRALSGV